MHNEVIPWLPLPDLPETPCGIEIKGGPEKVTVRAVYSFYGGDRDLLIDLKADIFGCFSEMAAPSVSAADDYPRLKQPEYSQYVWPLMEVTNSAWLESYRDRLWVPVTNYRHFRIVSDDGSFDALTREEPFARWEPVRG